MDNTTTAEVHKEPPGMQNSLDLYERLNNLPHLMKQQLIDALIKSQKKDEHDETQNFEPIQPTAPQTNDSWRNGTLHSSSSAISSTPTTDSAKTNKQPSMITSSTYEYIDNETANANNHPPTDDVTVTQQQHLDELTDSLDKQKFQDTETSNKSPDSKSADITKHNTNAYKSIISTHVLRAPKLAAPTPNAESSNPHAATDNQILQSTMNYIINSTENKVIPAMNKIQQTKHDHQKQQKLRQKSNFDITSDSSDTSDDDSYENAVLTATTENAVLTANKEQHNHQGRNYTLKDVEDLLADRPLGPETKNGILASRPDTPNSDYPMQTDAYTPH